MLPAAFDEDVKAYGLTAMPFLCFFGGFLVCESRTHLCARAHGRPIMGFFSFPISRKGKTTKKKKKGGVQSSVRALGPNGRPRAPAPSALAQQHFTCAFSVQIAAPLCPATLPALPTESPLRRWPPRFTATNYIFIISDSNSLKFWNVTRALAFPLQGTANPDGPGTTGLGGCSSPIPGVARPPSIIPHSILRTPFARSIVDLARIRSC
ncbi:hypothetical protein EVAR_98604_1 [Eumeta japonica]|uniref:Uncharacterized protein n=1 Tax=Eumeta variegata TaxID=151549 RepID=A0A4C1XUJ0_EUMVA|nr:hypothetical protein EVAR_98604_1 [Eumeta japonica]